MCSRDSVSVTQRFLCIKVLKIIRRSGKNNDLLETEQLQNVKNQVFSLVKVTCSLVVCW